MIVNYFEHEVQFALSTYFNLLFQMYYIDLSKKERSISLIMYLKLNLRLPLKFYQLFAQVRLLNVFNCTLLCCPLSEKLIKSIVYLKIRALYPVNQVLMKQTLIM